MPRYRLPKSIPRSMMPRSWRSTCAPIRGRIFVQRISRRLTWLGLSVPDKIILGGRLYFCDRLALDEFRFLAGFSFRASTIPRSGGALFDSTGVLFWPCDNESRSRDKRSPAAERHCEPVDVSALWQGKGQHPPHKKRRVLCAPNLT